eukprot:tig00000169_g11874.t1
MHAGGLYRAAEASSFVILCFIWPYIRRRLLVRGKYGAVSFALSEVQQLRHTPYHTSVLCGICLKPIDERPWKAKLNCGHNFHPKCLQERGEEVACTVCGGAAAGAGGRPGVATEEYVKGALRLIRARFGELVPAGAEESFQAASSPILYSLDNALAGRTAPAGLGQRAAWAACASPSEEITAFEFHEQIRFKRAEFAFFRLNFPALLETKGAPERQERAALAALLAFLACAGLAAGLSYVAPLVPQRWAFAFPLLCGFAWSLLVPTKRPPGGKGRGPPAP